MTSNVTLPCIQNNCAPPLIYTEQRLSIVSIVCRICYDNEKEEPLITPCRCKGTVAFVHKSCLETWLAESNTSTCELCHQIFKTERTPRYSSLKSIWRWLRAAPANQRGARGVKSDLLACGLLTPIAIIITYICLFSSDYYNQKKFATIPAARWTSLSLLFMIAIMLIGYYLWVYSVIRLHARMWYNWWQRECVVKYVPPSTINICPTCPSSVNTPHNTPLTRTNSVENITDSCFEPRTHSIFELEREEAEIHNENLDRLTDNKQKSAASEDDISIDIEDEVPPRDNIKVTNKNESLTLIQNKGVVHILNFTEPTDMSTSLHERLNLLHFCKEFSDSSDNSNISQIHTDNISDAKSKGYDEVERLTLSNSASDGDKTDLVRTNVLRKSEDCISITGTVPKQVLSIQSNSFNSHKITPYIKPVVHNSQDMLPFDVISVPGHTKKKTSKTKPARKLKRVAHTSSEEESSTESEDKTF